MTHGNGPKIKVMLVLDNLTVGGAQRLVVDLVRFLTPRRFEPVVCTLFSNRDPEPERYLSELNTLGMRTYRLSLTSWRDLKGIARFRALVGREGVDIIHSHMVPADFWGCLLGKLFRRRATLFTRHNTYDLNGLSTRVQNLLLKTLVADKVVAVSRSVSENLQTVWKVPEKRIVTILNGVDVQRFHPRVSGAEVREELGIDEGDLVVGNHSRFEARKGHDIFLQVAEQVLPQYRKLKFLAVGHGDRFTHLRKIATRPRFRGRLLVAPTRLDMPQVLAAMDFLLFTPYWGEGLPLAVLEAMATGLPVIASNVGSIPEVVQDGVTGRLPFPKTWSAEADYLDSRAFAEALAELIESRREMWREIGARGRAYVTAHHDIRAMVRSHEMLYESLLNGR